MNKNKHGFTLIELLVVISIIGILMGLLISQLGGILGSSEKTKMQAIMRTWIIQLNEYKSHYGYYPPFLYEGEEGTPILLSEGDNQNKFIYSLKGKVKTETGWGDSESLSDENKDQKEFHAFSEDEFDGDGNLISLDSLRILVDFNGDGTIEIGEDVKGEIISSLSLDYNDDEMSLIEKNGVPNINESIVLYILTDEKLGISNIYSWNIEK
ncbi:MAG: type II secretion system protein, partial [Verrucomicrobia bacterium]|nr:type II secretion system protein [Verrucomicrobiota bacterium]